MVGERDGSINGESSIASDCLSNFRLDLQSAKSNAYDFLTRIERLDVKKWKFHSNAHRSRIAFISNDFHAQLD